MSLSRNYTIGVLETFTENVIEHKLVHSLAHLSSVNYGEKKTF